MMLLMGYASSVGENSKHLKVLLQEKEILKAELKEANAKVVKLQEQLRGSVLVYAN